MATLVELFNLRNESALLNKVASAVAIKAHGIMAEATPSAERLDWAEQALANAERQARDLIWYLLAANESATVQQITDATDASIKTAVSDAVDKLRP